MTENKGFSTTFTISAKESEIKVNLPVQINLDEKFKYEIGLIWFSTYNTVANVTDENNTFYLIYDPTNMQREIYLNFSKFLSRGRQDFPFSELKLKKGPRGFKEINNEIMTLTNNKIKIETNEKTSISKITILSDCYIEFDKQSIFHTMHGFDKIDVEKYPSHKKFIEEDHSIIAKSRSITLPPSLKDYESKYTFQITDINIVNIECNIANGGYVSIEDKEDIKSNIESLKNTNIIYSFPAFSVPIGYKISERPAFVTYYPVYIYQINDFTIRIIDDKNRLINFNNERINICLRLRQSEL